MDDDNKKALNVMANKGGDEAEVDSFEDTDLDESTDEDSSTWVGSVSNFNWISSFTFKKSFFRLDKSSVIFSYISVRMLFISWAFSPLLKKSNAEITNTEINMKMNRAPISLIS